MSFKPVTIQDVVNALEPLDRIPHPEGDNEGDPLNGDTVYPHLSPKHQDQVDHAVETVTDYIRFNRDEPNNRAITEMNKKGFRTNLDPSQYTPYAFQGEVVGKSWSLDLSDPSSEEDF